MRGRCVLFVLLALLLFDVAAEPAHRAGDIVLKSGEATASDGTVIAYELGTLYVPENRAAKESRLIAVGFIRIKGAQSAEAPPRFLLIGGPGVTVLETVSEQSEIAKRRLRSWLDWAGGADFVFIEQRGWALAGEQLDWPIDAQPLDRPGSVAADIAATQAAARRVVADHPGKDLAGYTIAACADDVDDLRRALGYDKIVLNGASFGSQWAFATMRRHPDIVLRAVLSSVEPLDNGFDMPSHVYAALQRIAFEADQDPGLKPYLPAGGVMAAACAVRDRLAQKPIAIEVKNEQGTSQQIVLGLEDFQLALSSHASNAAEWPAFVLSLYHGHYEAWARETIELRQASHSPLIGPLIDTSLGVTKAREHQLRTDPAVDMLGTWNFAPYLASADLWPTPDLGDAMRRPQLDRTPLLLIHGDWDTNTPIENSLETLASFPNARLIRVHRGQHTGPFALLRGHPEEIAAVHEFLRSGTMPEVPIEVALPPVTFEKPAFAAP